MLDFVRRKRLAAGARQLQTVRAPFGGNVYAVSTVIRKRCALSNGKEHVCDVLFQIPPLLKGGGYTWQYWWDEIRSYNDLSFKTYSIGIVGLTLQCLF